MRECDFIDLISERHLMLRRICDTLWNKTDDFSISNSEWYIMSRIYQKQPTISYVSKHVDISRQATHKIIKKLESKGIVEVTSSKNRREKCIQLTKLGEECYEKYMSLKTSLEKKIEEKIGSEQFALLKQMLQADWGL